MSVIKETLERTRSVSRARMLKKKQSREQSKDDPSEKVTLDTWKMLLLGEKDLNAEKEFMDLYDDPDVKRKTGHRDIIRRLQVLMNSCRLGRQRVNLSDIDLRPRSQQSEWY